MSAVPTPPETDRELRLQKLEREVREFRGLLFLILTIARRPHPRAAK